MGDFDHKVGQTDLVFGVLPGFISRSARKTTSLCEATMICATPVNIRVRTPGHVPKKTRWVFWVNSSYKTRLKNPAQNKQILMLYSTVKEIFTRLKDVNI